MALEAATQTIELEGTNATRIERFELRDVHLAIPLIVPEDDDGIETLFTMRPVSLNACTHYESRFEFTLTSVLNEDGKDDFIQHCRGVIDVKIKSSGGQI